MGSCIKPINQNRFIFYQKNGKKQGLEGGKAFRRRGLKKGCAFRWLYLVVEHVSSDGLESRRTNGVKHVFQVGFETRSRRRDDVFFYH